MIKRPRQPICTRRELDETPFLIRAIHFKNQPTSAIIFAFEGIRFAAK